jgi:hypothetical protein
MHPAQDRAAVAKKNGFEPPFWDDFGHSLALRKGYASTHSTLAVVQDICAVVCLPFAPYTQARETSDRKNSWILAVGFVENGALIFS